MKWTKELSLERHHNGYGGHYQIEYEVDGQKFYSLYQLAFYLDRTKGSVQGKLYRDGTDKVEIDGKIVKRRIVND